MFWFFCAKDPRFTSLGYFDCLGAQGEVELASYELSDNRITSAPVPLRARRVCCWKKKRDTAFFSASRVKTYRTAVAPVSANDRAPVECYEANAKGSN